eukprot:g6794.t1
MRPMVHCQVPRLTCSQSFAACREGEIGTPVRQVRGTDSLRGRPHDAWVARGVPAFLAFLAVRSASSGALRSTRQLRWSRAPGAARHKEQRPAHVQDPRIRADLDKEIQAAEETVQALRHSLLKAELRLKALRQRRNGGGASHPAESQRCTAPKEGLSSKLVGFGQLKGLGDWLAQQSNSLLQQAEAAGEQEAGELDLTELNVGSMFC